MSSKSADEESWKLLSTYLQLLGQFDVFIIGCADDATRAALRDRLRARGLERGLEFSEPAASSGIPEDPLDWLARQRAAAESAPGARLYFLPIDDDERAHFTVHRLNEHRDNLRRELNGALCLVGTHDFLRWLPGEAPDFWSGRTQSFEFRSLSPQAPGSPSPHLESAPPSLPNPPSLTLQELIPQPQGISDQRSSRVPARFVATAPRDESRPEYDVFLSYVTTEESSFAAGLARRLESDGLRCLLKEKTALAGNRLEALTRALEGSRHFVAVCSGNYGETQWTRTELRAGLSRVHQGLATLSVLLRGGGRIPAQLRSFSSLDFSTDERIEESYPRLCRTLGGLPVSAMRRDQLPPLPETRSPDFHAPDLPRDIPFIGATERLWKLFDHLRLANTVFLAGPRGIGKTRTALEYAHRFAPYYPGGVFFLSRSGSPTDMARSIARLAGIRLSPAPGEEMASFWRAIARRPRMLIVLDESGDGAEFDPRPFLPQSDQVHLVITTEEAPSEHFGAVLPLEGLSDDATDQLMVATGTPVVRTMEMSERRLLREIWGGSPQRILTTGTYLSGGQGEKDWDDLVSKGGVRDAALERYWEIAPPVVRTAILNLAALGGSLVPKGIFDDAQARLASTIPENTALEGMLNAILIHEGDRITLHSAFVGVGDEKLTGAEARPIIEACAAALSAPLSRILDDRDSAAIKELEPLIRPAEALAGHAWREGEWKIAAALARPLTEYLLKVGEYVAAHFWAERGLEAITRGPVVDEAAVARARSDLGCALHLLGRSSEAVELLQQAVELSERLPPADRAELPAVLSNLGLALAACGDLAAARSVLQRALDLGGQIRGAGSPHYATSLANLAGVMFRLGETAEAESSLQRALAIHERAYGPVHPFVATNLLNLATLRYSNGDSVGARGLARRALSIAESLLSPTHPLAARARAMVELTEPGR